MVFALATDGGYSKEQILDMEFRVMKVLSYKLHPITLCTWANWFMNMWDVYSEQNLRQQFPVGHDLTFKTPNEIAYQRLRIFFQVLDCINLNVHTLLYCSRNIIACLLYCIIGGPHMFGAFPYDYHWLPSLFL